MLEFLAHVPPLIFAIVVALVLVLGCVAALLFGSAYGPQARLQKRIASVVGGPVESDKKARGSGDKRRGVEAKLREIERLKKSKRGYRLQEELVQSGLSLSARNFILVSVGFGAAACIVYMILGLPMIGVPLVAITCMLGMPKFYLGFRVKRRLKKFTSLFADAIDIIVRGVRTGLTVGECLAIVGREMPDPVGTEFRTMTEGIRLGMTLEECLNRLYQRVPITEVRFFSIVLVMQQSTGGNLAETLEKLSDVIRSRKRMRDKIQALSGEAKASAGIVGSLPVFVALALSVVSPDYIAVLATTDAGKWLILAGLIWMSIGIFVMAKLIHFDY